MLGKHQDYRPPGSKHSGLTALTREKNSSIFHEERYTTGHLRLQQRRQHLVVTLVHPSLPG